MSPLTREEKEIAGRLKTRMARTAAAFAFGVEMPRPMGPICAAVAVALAGVSQVADRYENDPPDPQFEKRVVPFRRPIDLKFLARSGADPSLVRLAADLREAEAYASAAIRAYERAQGAYVQGRDEATAERMADAKHFAYAASTHFSASADQLRTTDLKAIHELVMAGRPDRQPRLLVDLPDWTLADLFTAQVRFHDLDEALKIALSVPESGSDDSVLIEAADIADEFAAQVQDWSPTIEPPGSWA